MGKKKKRSSNYSHGSGENEIMDDMNTEEETEEIEEEKVEEIEEESEVVVSEAAEETVENLVEELKKEITPDSDAAEREKYKHDDPTLGNTTQQTIVSERSGKSRKYFE